MGHKKDTITYGVYSGGSPLRDIAEAVAVLDAVQPVGNDSNVVRLPVDKHRYRAAQSPCGSAVGRDVMVAAMAAQRQRGKRAHLWVSALLNPKSALHAECSKVSDNNRADDVSNARYFRCKRDELICLLNCLKRTHHFIHAASAEGTYVRYATIAIRRNGKEC